LTKSAFSLQLPVGLDWPVSIHSSKVKFSQTFISNIFILCLLAKHFVAADIYEKSAA